MADPIRKNEWGDDVYQTPNGERTGTQITQELGAAGWGGQGDAVSVYNQVSGAAQAGNAPSSPGTPDTPYQGTAVGRDIEGSKLILQDAQNKAQQAYYNAMLRHEGDKLAFEKAKQAFDEAIARAGMTGMFEGAPTLPAQMGYAEMFGTWGTPAQGQKTLTAEQQAFNQALSAAGLTGQWQGAQTQQAQEQAYTQWLRTAQEARQNQALQQQTAQNYLNLLSQMRGPQNYFQYQNVLGATPGGMKDLVAAAMGQYIPGGGATTGVQPVPQNLQSTMADITGQGYGSQVYNQEQGALASQLPAPNQIAPQSWANLAPSQRQLLMSAYENQGWNAEDVKGMFEQSLPKYGSQTPAGAGTFKLQ